MYQAWPKGQNCCAILLKNIAYHSHTADVILEMEVIASARLSGWEAEIIHSMQEGHSLSESSAEFLAHPTYGDGGMAAAVRVRLKNNRKVSESRNVLELEQS